MAHSGEMQSISSVWFSPGNCIREAARFCRDQRPACVAVRFVYARHQTFDSIKLFIFFCLPESGFQLSPLQNSISACVRASRGSGEGGQSRALSLSLSFSVSRLGCADARISSLAGLAPTHGRVCWAGLCFFAPPKIMFGHRSVHGLYIRSVLSNKCYAALTCWILYNCTMAI